MNDDNVIPETVTILRELGYRVLACKLERDAKNTIPKVVNVLREHHFHRLADRLAAYTASDIDTWESLGLGFVDYPEPSQTYGADE